MKKLFEKIKSLARLLGHFFSLPFVLPYFMLLIKKSKNFFLSYEADPEEYSEDKRYNFVLKQIRVCLFLMNIKVKYENTKNISKKNLFYVSNHKSNFDPIIFLNLFRKKSELVKPIFVAKKEIENDKKFYYSTKIINTIFLDRSNLRDIVRCINIQKEELIKHSVMIFPEGTRSFEHDFKEFKSASIEAAVSTLTTIQPLVIYGLANIDNKKKSFLKPKNIIIKFLDPIKPKDFSTSDKKFVIKKIQKKIEDEYNLLKEKNN